VELHLHADAWAQGCRAYFRAPAKDDRQRHTLAQVNRDRQVSVERGCAASLAIWDAVYEAHVNARSRGAHVPQHRRQGPTPVCWLA
jgi:hypothetical protein